MTESLAGKLMNDRMPHLFVYSHQHPNNPEYAIVCLGGDETPFLLKGKDYYLPSLDAHIVLEACLEYVRLPETETDNVNIHVPAKLEHRMNPVAIPWSVVRKIRRAVDLYNRIAVFEMEQGINIKEGVGHDREPQ